MGAPVNHKRMKPKVGAPPTAAEKRHMERVVQLPCLVSGKHPVTLHHVTGYARIMGRFARSHQLVVPLAPEYHLKQFGEKSVEARHGIDMKELARAFVKASPKRIELERARDERTIST